MSDGHDQMCPLPEASGTLLRWAPGNCTYCDLVAKVREEIHSALIAGLDEWLSESAEPDIDDRSPYGTGTGDVIPGYFIIQRDQLADYIRRAGE